MDAPNSTLIRSRSAHDLQAPATSNKSFGGNTSYDELDIGRHAHVSRNG